MCLLPSTAPSGSRCAAWTARAKKTEIEADGLLARALQHEIDHLDGLVLFDRLNSVKREFVKKRYLKALKRAERKGD